MKKSRVTLIAIVAIIVIALLVWFIGNHFATREMDRELNRFVREHQLQDNLTWKDTRATILGSGTIKEITYTEGKNVITVEKADINKLKNKENEFAADVELKNIKAVSADPNLKQSELAEVLPFRWNDIDHPIKKAHINVDFDRKKNTQSLELNVEQDDVAYSDINLKTRNLEQIFSFVTAKAKSSSSASDITPPDAKIGLDLLAKGEIDSSSVKVEDKGLVDMIQHTKDGQYKPLLADEKQCMQNLELFGIKKGDSYCKPVWQFLNKKEKKLEVSIDPSKPYPVMAIPQLIYGGHGLLINKLTEDLKLKVSN